MTAEKNKTGEGQLSTIRGMDSVNVGSMGRVDWSPLCKLTGYRPQVSKYSVQRYSPWEWKLAYSSLIGQTPSASTLKHESENLALQIATVLDKEQTENTLRLGQRAIEVTVKHDIIYQLCTELKEEIKQMELCKKRLQKAMVFLGVVEGINTECRNIRKNRLTEDLVRDEVEEELFQEQGLCQEIRQLYNSTLAEFEIQYGADKSCLQEVNVIWSNQSETLRSEAEIIGLTSTSDQISFCHGNARREGNTSTVEIWEAYLNKTSSIIQETINKSKALRVKVHSIVLSDSTKDMKEKEQKLLRAFLKRIDEVICARSILEGELELVVNEIARAEEILIMLNRLGRQMDFNLKVVQTRLESRRHRPEVENCRDEPEFGLLRELKTINHQMSSLQAQIDKVEKTIKKMYEERKKLERQVHVKRHSLYLDQERCMVYRSKFPSTAYLLGY